MLVEFFRAKGVPSAQIAYLQDGEATTERIESAFEAHLAACDSGDLLVVYYCGHGYKDESESAAYFASYDADRGTNPGWGVDTIPATIERRFCGSRALLLADACYSGSIADAVVRHAKRISYACLTSSLASELSTGNWTFTEGLLAGLRGQAFVDADGDGMLTLRELAGQISDTMAFAEDQLVTFETTGGFDPDLVIATAHPRSEKRVGRRVAVLENGTWYRAQVIEVRDERLKVHYYGYEESAAEWVTGERIREVARPVYPIGATVEVNWKEQWYPATVKDVRAGIHCIQYEDYDPRWNEWVAFKRIRPLA